ncbi:hypothetical protein [uncultured Caulobacter sp.]|uniref:hypothetical protein n=1 Tax=uncultured Caulobacter sp. TaxID=158749 RepID=UPI002634F6EF|nr:hypothetical protein [uncultured Caulobacter sp.]
MSEDELTDAEFEAFLEKNPSTLPPFSYTFRGIDQEGVRNALVSVMQPLADLMSRLFSLKGLDGVTVATDYHEALNALDRGADAKERITPTTESFGTGLAMALGIVKDGRMRTHVVLQAGLAGGLLSDDPGLRALSVHTFMHELGHVAEHTLDHDRFGAAMVKPYKDRYAFELYRYSHSAWSEYFASRVSASWGQDVLEGLRELFEGSLRQALEKITAARRLAGPFSGTANDDAAMAIIEQVSKLMKFAGYVIGHARGEEVEPLEAGSAHRALLEKLGLSDWFDRLALTLDDLYESRLEWTDLTVFGPLHRLLEDGCRTFKVELRPDEEYGLAWRIWF